MPRPGSDLAGTDSGEFFGSLFVASPNLRITPEVLVADDEHVALAYTLTGHRGVGDFHGVTPTGKPVEVRGLQIGRFAAGQIVERWGAIDEFAILRQLGVATTGDDERGVRNRSPAAGVGTGSGPGEYQWC
jgi:hypothetical protein